MTVTTVDTYTHSGAPDAAAAALLAAYCGTPVPVRHDGPGQYFAVGHDVAVRLLDLAPLDDVEHEAASVAGQLFLVAFFYPHTSVKVAEVATTYRPSTTWMGWVADDLDDAPELHWVRFERVDAHGRPVPRPAPYRPTF